jgi:hypothetical protein
LKGIGLIIIVVQRDFKRAAFALAVFATHSEDVISAVASVDGASVWANKHTLKRQVGSVLDHTSHLKFESFLFPERNSKFKVCTKLAPIRV